MDMNKNEIKSTKKEKKKTRLFIPEDCVSECFEVPGYRSLEECKIDQEDLLEDEDVIVEFVEVKRYRVRKEHIIITEIK